ncbi:MAG: hypothetical protein QNJ84_02225 [Alphaproteobacteria bacterium]|nr:hypothetical protein [Alphaproteobacteria bacterium]
MITRRQLLGGLAVAASAPTARAAVSATSPGAFETEEILCCYAARPDFKKTSALRAPDPLALSATQAIIDLIGMRPVFHVHEADFNNGSVAFAAVRTRERHVVYDAKWFPFEEKGLGWYMVAILAHEIGHHIYGHTNGVGATRHRDELDADRFSGWAVARLGGAEEHALSFAPRLTLAATPSHPARPDRIEAYREG